MNLTKIYNRRGFFEILETEFKGATSQKGPIALVIIDIDFFKRVNDFYGHPTGDYVLCQVAEIIKSNIRSGDSVARLGGEEFAVIFPGADEKEAIGMAERIRRAVEGADWEGNIKITVSAGVASFPENSTTLTELIKKADHALYSAKAGGRNQVLSWAALTYQ